MYPFLYSLTGLILKDKRLYFTSIITNFIMLVKFQAAIVLAMRSYHPEAGHER